MPCVCVCVCVCVYVCVCVRVCVGVCVRSPNGMVVAVISRCVLVRAHALLQAEADRAEARRLEEARRAAEAAAKVCCSFV